VPDERNIRRASPERRVLANLALSYSAIGSDLDALARDFDRLSGDARRSRCFAIAEKLGALGDDAHETRRALRQLG